MAKEITNQFKIMAPGGTATPAPDEGATTDGAASVASPDAQATSPEPVASPVVEGGAAASGSGQVVYKLYDGPDGAGHLFRVAATAGAMPEDVSLALDDLGSPAPDDWVAISPDGEWLLLGTERFDPECAGWPCLAVVNADLSTGEVVRSAETVIHPEGPGTVASGGTLIVYPDDGGPHTLDLWAISRLGDGWTDPLLLTGESPHQYHLQPAISADGARVVFDCGNESYAAETTAICEVGTNGTGFQEILLAKRSPKEVADEWATFLTAEQKK